MGACSRAPIAQNLRMSEPHLYLERHTHHAELVLNRPQRRNALTEAMWAALPALLAEAEAARDVRLLVVRGLGGSFASGADISEFETVYSDAARAERYNDSIARALDSLAAFPKPTLARIEGACVGGGCGIALACDVRFACENSRFAITPAKLGLVYPLNDTRRLVAAVGSAYAKDILYSGRTLQADEALRIGLVQRCLPPEELEPAIADYQSLVLSRSNHTARMSKHFIRLIENGLDEETAQTRQIFHDAFDGADFREGYRAFLDKRAPRFPDPE